MYRQVYTVSINKCTQFHLIRNIFKIINLLALETDI